MLTYLRWKQFSPGGEAFHLASYQLCGEEHPGFHRQDYTEIFWIQSGEGAHIFPHGRQPLAKGFIALVGPETQHRFGSPTEMTLINVAFPNSTYELLQSVFPVLESLKEKSGLQLSNSALSGLTRSVAELAQSPRKQIYLSRFVASLACLLDEPESSLGGETPGWLRNAMEQIHTPELARQGVPGFLRLAGRSAEHVSRVTRQCTGKPPREIVKEARLQLAQERLVMTEDGIIEIAADCGFENLGHFYKVFKARFGLPPRTYRIQQKGLPAGIIDR